VSLSWFKLNIEAETAAEKRVIFPVHQTQAGYFFALAFNASQVSLFYESLAIAV
jgi:hypothetical protein